MRGGCLLFGGHLAHVDPDADDLARLHAHGAGRVLAAAAAAAVGGARGDGGVLDALAPGPRLPVVHGARVLVAAAHLLQGAGVGTLDAPWGCTEGQRAREGQRWDGGCLRMNPDMLQRDVSTTSTSTSRKP